ncbi:MAG: molybdenum cofactor biosynthesis protein MoaE [Planctomycetes bacterium]|nr:molybdenum cofactor biosynthesis protein MoaE [Planctomycetota bacterium]
MIEITTAPIDVASLLARGESAQAGALVLFLGTVRGSTRGRRVLRLEYEAFGEMARAELERVAAAARERHDITALDVVHRVGRLELGEVAVAIAVRAPHRDAAFDACRSVIDALKETVPIWKKEFFEDGAVWAGAGP